MDALTLFLYLAAILAGLVLFFLAILWLVPVRVAVRVVTAPGWRELDISSGFGPVGIVSKTSEGRTDLTVLVLNRVVATFEGEQGRAEQAVEEKEPPDHIRTAPDLIPVIRNLTSPAFRILGILYRQAKFERCDGRVRVGLGDPAATGLFYGSFWATRFIFTASRIFIRIEPVFDRKVLELDLVARYRIDHPLRILLQAVRELFRPEVRAGISAIRGAAGGPS